MPGIWLQHMSLGDTIQPTYHAYGPEASLPTSWGRHCQVELGRGLGEELRQAGLVVWEGVDEPPAVLVLSTVEGDAAWRL